MESVYQFILLPPGRPTEIFPKTLSTLLYGHVILVSPFAVIQTTQFFPFLRKTLQKVSTFFAQCCNYVTVKIHIDVFPKMFALRPQES